MAKEHYWISFGSSDYIETSMDTTTPLVTLATATRDKADTLIRAIAWMKLTVQVAATTPPDIRWLGTAAVDYLFFFDTESDSHAVDILTDDPYRVGFCRLDQRIDYTATTNVYTTTWQGPPAGLNLEGQRKGYSTVNLPSLSVQRWVQDDFGVFDNFGHKTVTMTSMLYGRALWASDLPAPP